jgi:hypothetical protein
MGSFGLFLELSQIGSGIRQMPCPSPTAKDGRGDIHLCPTNVANRANQARRVIKTTHRLVILGAKTPQVAALAKVLWARIVEMILDLVIRRKRGWGPPRCRSVEMVPSTGVPFRRCNYGCSRVAPTPVPLFLFMCIDQGMGDRCVAVFRDLDHHCAFPAEVYICDYHRLAFCVEKAGARTYLPH